MNFVRNTLWMVVVALGAGCGETVVVADAGADTGSLPTDTGSLPTDTGSLLDVVADARASCVMPGGGLCPVGSSCPHPDGCNSCSCAPSGGAAVCTAHPCAFDSGPQEDVSMETGVPDTGPVGCRSGSECGRDQECRFDGAGCGLRGVCGAITDCANVQAYCGCSGETFMDCPSAAQRPWVSRGACASDAGAPGDVILGPDAAQCGGASIGRSGDYCAGPTDRALPISCCTGWNCDQRLATCERIPPTCPNFEVPLINGGCYGACVPVTHCAPIRCETTCPSGWTCSVSERTCRFGR